MWRARAEPYWPWWWGGGGGVGIAVGGLGGIVTKLARERGWLSEELGGPAVLALALLAHTRTLLVDGNGFVAAFAGGLVFGNVSGHGSEKEVYFVEQQGAMASMVSWLIFGALAVPLIGSWLKWSVLLYVALSLTVVRMVPVSARVSGHRVRPILRRLHRLVRTSRVGLRDLRPAGHLPRRRPRRSSR